MVLTVIVCSLPSVLQLSADTAVSGALEHSLIASIKKINLKIWLSQAPL